MQSSHDRKSVPRIIQNGPFIQIHDHAKRLRELNFGSVTCCRREAAQTKAARSSSQFPSRLSPFILALLGSETGQSCRVFRESCRGSNCKLQRTRWPSRKCVSSPLLGAALVSEGGGSTAVWNTSACK